MTFDPYAGIDFIAFAESDWTNTPTAKTQGKWKNNKTGRIVYAKANPGISKAGSKPGDQQPKPESGAKPAPKPAAPKAPVAAKGADREAAHKAASDLIAKIKGGDKSPQHAEALIGHLGKLTVPQLKQLRDANGLKCPEKLKAPLVAKMTQMLQGQASPADVAQAASGTVNPEAAQPSAPKDASADFAAMYQKAKDSTLTQQQIDDGIGRLASQPLAALNDILKSTGSTIVEKTKKDALDTLKERLVSRMESTLAVRGVDAAQTPSPKETQAQPPVSAPKEAAPAPPARPPAPPVNAPPPEPKPAPEPLEAELHASANPAQPKKPDASGEFKLDLDKKPAPKKETPEEFIARHDRELAEFRKSLEKPEATPVGGSLTANATTTAKPSPPPKTEGEGSKWGTKEQPYYRPGANPTVDNVITRDGPNGKEALLIKRKADSPTEGGKWALPGGFHDSEAKKGEPWREGKETAEQAALRELAEETGLDASSLKEHMRHVGTYEGGGRDPRDNKDAWSKSNAFHLHLPPELANKVVKGQDDASDAKWHPVDQIKGMAFDHDKILSDAMKGAKPAVPAKAVAAPVAKIATPKKPAAKPVKSTSAPKVTVPKPAAKPPAPAAKPKTAEETKPASSKAAAPSTAQPTSGSEKIKQLFDRSKQPGIRYGDIDAVVNSPEVTAMPKKDIEDIGKKIGITLSGATKPELLKRLAKVMKDGTGMVLRGIVDHKDLMDKHNKEAIENRKRWGLQDPEDHYFGS